MGVEVPSSGEEGNLTSLKTTAWEANVFGTGPFIPQCTSHVQTKPTEQSYSLI